MATSILDWAATAKKGQAYIFATGAVAYMRENKSTNPEIINEVKDAYMLYENKLVTLVQRRIGRNLFEYIAQRI